MSQQQCGNTLKTARLVPSGGTHHVVESLWAIKYFVFLLQMDNPVSTSISYIGSQNNATHYSQVSKDSACAGLCRLISIHCSVWVKGSSYYWAFHCYICMWKQNLLHSLWRSKDMYSNMWKWKFLWCWLFILLCLEIWHEVL